MWLISPIGGQNVTRTACHKQGDVIDQEQVCHATTLQIQILWSGGHPDHSRKTCALGPTRGARAPREVKGRDLSGFVLRMHSVGGGGA
ncbi:hypothetical protein Baya_3293 [Bagarius yarrelli]|uniref:Uncharacterized protein n=1 Tax=Bagarius yarrelli TaxID=175774 RepID=A0A556TSB5_BAGYA|nr:hypothetical protein Baya_3293 [Bagarius yarrelli]